MQHSLFVVVKKHRRQNITKSKGDSLFCNLQANPIFFHIKWKGIERPTRYIAIRGLTMAVSSGF